MVKKLALPASASHVVYIQAISEKKHRAASEVDKEREKGQVKGMAIAKKAVEGQAYFH